MKSFVFLILFVGLLVLAGFVRMMFPTDISLLIYGLLGCLAGYLTLFIFLKVEKKTWAEMGFAFDSYTPLRFLAGLGIGTMLMAALMLSLLSFTSLRMQFEPGSFNATAWILVIQVFLLALMEEIGFRSYAQQELFKKYGVWASQLLIALAFAVYHVLNGWPIGLSFSGPFVWAFVFGLAALRSGGIAMPTGIHFALNILQTLMGLKGTDNAIWKLDYPTGTSEAAMAKTDTVGVILHLCLLIIFIIATYFYNRYKNTSDL